MAVAAASRVRVWADYVAMPGRTGEAIAARQP
jgi:hypothetical protein